MRANGRISIWAIFICALAGMFISAPGQYKRELTHRIYMEQYFPTDKMRTDSAISHLKMAAYAGYNGMLLIGPQDIGTIEKWTPAMKSGYARVRAEAEKRKIAVVSQNFSALTGAYGDPMIAEVSAARGTPFKVSGKEARCHSDHNVGLVNGDFENFSGNSPIGWKQRNLIGSLIRDGGTKHSGSFALRVINIQASSRIHQDITVKPYRAYRISAWFKTQGLKVTRDVEFVVKGKEELLNRRWAAFASPNGKGWYNNSFRTTMKWTKCTADFNSQNNTKVNIAFWFATAGYGAGAQGDGIIWMDEMKVEEVGLYETVRRDDCPITVKSADGSKIYKEGTDYVVDPNCNKFRAPASYYYEGHLKIPAGSSIKDGDMLKVDWFKHSDNYLMYSETDFCIPETWDAMKDNVVRIDNLMGHSKWSFLNYDEWRSAFQSPHCPLFPNAKTAGDYLAAALEKTVKTCRSINNINREVWVYNDMYDPYHNARDAYGMCVGGTDESWKGLDTSVIVINWRPGPSPADANSFAFYMGLDPKRKGIVNRQIIFTQGPCIANRLRIVDSLEQRGGRGVIGMCFCTWYNVYGQMVNAANLCKARSWWGSKPLPSKPVVRPPDWVSIDGNTESAKRANASMRILNGAGSHQIEYRLPYICNVELRVVNARGRTIRRMARKDQGMGVHRMRLNTASVPTGVYFFDLRVDGRTARRIKQAIM